MPVGFPVARIRIRARRCACRASTPQELGLQAIHERREQIHRHDGRFAQIRLEHVALRGKPSDRPRLRASPVRGFARRARRRSRCRRPRAPVASRGDHDAPVAGAEIVDDVVRLNIRKPQHLVDVPRVDGTYGVGTSSAAAAAHAAAPNAMIAQAIRGNAIRSQAWSREIRTDEAAHCGGMSVGGGSVKCRGSHTSVRAALHGACFARAAPCAPVPSMPLLTMRPLHFAGTAAIELRDEGHLVAVSFASSIGTVLPSTDSVPSTFWKIWLSASSKLRCGPFSGRSYQRHLPLAFAGTTQ